MALSVGLCIVLTDNLTGPQTNGLLQACDTVVGTGSPLRGKILAGKILANHYSWIVIFVVERYIAIIYGYVVVEQYIAIIYSYVTIVHFEIKASNSVQK